MLWKNGNGLGVAFPEEARPPSCPQDANSPDAVTPANGACETEAEARDPLEAAAGAIEVGGGGASSSRSSAAAGGGGGGANFTRLTAAEAGGGSGC